MVSDLRAVAQRRAGRLLRIPKFTWAQVQRQDRDAPSLQVTPEHTNPAGVERLPKGSCLEVLGTYTHCDGGLGLEYREAVCAAWRVYHCKKDLLRTRGLRVQKIRAAPSECVSCIHLVRRNTQLDPHRIEGIAHPPVEDDSASLRVVAAGRRRLPRVCTQDRSSSR